jgi:hypothetical protein
MSAEILEKNLRTLVSALVVCSILLSLVYLQYITESQQYSYLGASRWSDTYHLLSFL